MDLPHGASMGDKTNMIEYAQALRTAIDYFGDTYAIVGHSFGGTSTAYMLGTYQDVTIQKISIEWSYG